jgi:hypothetical protein
MAAMAEPPPPAPAAAAAPAPKPAHRVTIIAVKPVPKMRKLLDAPAMAMGDLFVTGTPAAFTACPPCPSCPQCPGCPQCPACPANPAPLGAEKEPWWAAFAKIVGGAVGGVLAAKFMPFLKGAAEA